MPGVPRQSGLTFRTARFLFLSAGILRPSHPPEPGGQVNGLTKTQNGHSSRHRRIRRKTRRILPVIQQEPRRRRSSARRFLSRIQGNQVWWPLSIRTWTCEPRRPVRSRGTDNRIWAWRARQKKGKKRQPLHIDRISSIAGLRSRIQPPLSSLFIGLDELNHSLSHRHLSGDLQG